MRAGPCRPGAQAIASVARKPLPPAVEERPGDPERAAGLADIAQGRRPLHGGEAVSQYTVLEGHLSTPSQGLAGTKTSVGVWMMILLFSPRGTPQVQTLHPNRTT
jgi:hypothetical protein